MHSLSSSEGFSRSRVAGLVLAGGLGRRMGGEDKGLVEIAGRPMVEFVLEALRPQVGSVMINANRNLDRYAAFGHPVVPDELSGFLGPLAGVASALPYLAADFLLTVPCDAPLLSAHLARRLFDACAAAGADVAVAHDGRRLQPVFMLLRASAGPSLRAYLEGGGRKVDSWFAQVRLAQADFSDEPDCFANVNEPDERQRLEASLVSQRAVR